jgi:sigma-E factor negative regulatory protein RseC
MPEFPDPDDARLPAPHVMEAVARVVAVEHGVAVLEPEPTGSCSGCMSAALCGAQDGKGRRMLAKRFTLTRPEGLQIGERVVVGIAEGALLRAALVAYGLPLLGMLVSMVLADRLDGDELRTMMGAAIGLVAGILVARLLAARLAARGDLAPRFVRRAYGPGPGGGCHTDLT